MSVSRANTMMEITMLALLHQEPAHSNKKKGCK